VKEEDSDKRRLRKAIVTALDSSAFFNVVIQKEETSEGILRRADYFLDFDITSYKYESDSLSTFIGNLLLVMLTLGIAHSTDPGDDKVNMVVALTLRDGWQGSVLAENKVYYYYTQYHSRYTQERGCHGPPSRQT